MLLAVFFVPGIITEVTKDDIDRTLESCLNTQDSSLQYSCMVLGAQKLAGTHGKERGLLACDRIKSYTGMATTSKINQITQVCKEEITKKY
ncbi:hypothetical protein K8R43_00165 [archaeon]|nr:hypothetical protein [archaeon]